MVDVAQLVRASGCGPEGRGFKSRHPPQLVISKRVFQITYNVNGLPLTQLLRIELFFL